VLCSACAMMAPPSHLPIRRLWTGQHSQVPASLTTWQAAIGGSVAAVAVSADEALLSRPKSAGAWRPVDGETAGSTGHGSRPASRPRATPLPPAWTPSPSSAARTKRSSTATTAPARHPRPLQRPRRVHAHWPALPKLASDRHQRTRAVAIRRMPPCRSMARDGPSVLRDMPPHRLQQRVLLGAWGLEHSHRLRDTRRRASRLAESYTIQGQCLSFQYFTSCQRKLPPILSPQTSFGLDSRLRGNDV